jgi:PAS domain S-box-containing protein
VSSENQAVLLNAIPLFALSVLYLLATAALAPSFWRERRRTKELEFALAFFFPFWGVATAVIGVLVLIDREPIGGTAWISFAAILLGLLPGLAFLARWGDRALLLARPRLAREAEQRTLAQEQARERLNAFTADLSRAVDVESVARLLVDAVLELIPVEFAALSLIEGGEARGLVARHAGEEVRWWADLRLDLEHEPSAIASAAFEAAPFAVYDVSASSSVNHRIADRVGAKSGIWVPLISGEAVVAVLAAATTREQRTFSNEEVRLLQELTDETALALERARSASALGEALERERFVAALSRRLRQKLDLDSAVRLAVEEAGPALRASRCFVWLGEPGRLRIGAEWDSVGVEPIGAQAEELPLPQLTARERRTVAIADVAEAPELEEWPGARDLLLGLGARSILDTPIVVFNELIGVLGFHRTKPEHWPEADVTLAESVARELGLVLHTARVLEESERRLNQESALLEAAESVTSEFEAAAVLSRVVQEVARLLEGQAADCYLLDRERGVLRCAAVHGLPGELVGLEFSADVGLSGEALARGRVVNAAEYRRLRDPIPNEAYGDFDYAIVAPVTWSGEPHGVLGVGATRERGPFDQGDADVLQAFARLASLALRNAEAFEARSRQARIQRGFYLIASVLGQSLSLADSLEAVAHAASEAFGGDFATVLMPRGPHLEPAGSKALPERLADALEEGLPRTETVLYHAAQERRIVAAPTVAGDERFEPAWRELAVRAGYRSLLAIPVEAHDEQSTAGLVIVFFVDERRFTDDDVELAEQLSKAARGALERSGLFEQERVGRSFAQQLAQTATLLAGGLDPAAVLDEVVRQAHDLVSADACLIRLLEEDELVVGAAEGDVAAAEVGARTPASGRASGDVVQTRAPVAIEDAAGDERLARADPLLGGSYRAFLGVPLAAPEGAMHGVLAVYARRPKAWREEEIQALLALGGNASAALSNAELYQRVALEKEQSDAILSNIADGIVAVDREGRVVLWNRAAEQITGVPTAEALGRPPAQVLGRPLESEEAATGERLVSLQRAGEDIWISLTEAIMRDPAGAVAGRIYAFRDISADLLVEQLKSDFVATVSQELRRPLTSIYGFAETLLRRDVIFEEDERRTFLNYIASESERLTTIVDALLNVARLDAGDLQVNVASTDVRSVVSEVVSGAEQSVVDGHRFVVELPDEPLAAAADPEKLRDVLTHLIDNAVRYSPGGGTVTVAVRRRNDSVEVSVADEGVGIPTTDQARIFRKFYRGDVGASRASIAGGTGLGLFIVKGLVSAMGGRIWVTSREGEGSSFTFELPLAGRESGGQRV